MTEKFIIGLAGAPFGVTIPDSVTIIGWEAFNRCTKLTGVTISNRVTMISSGTFLECTSLTGITIPNSVTSIDRIAFYDCKNLADVTIPDSVTDIDSSSFENTAWYNKQPNGVVYAGKFAYAYKGTMPANTRITLLDGTKAIARSAFVNCTGLTGITIPDSVISIGNYAFNYCKNLTSVTFAGTIPSSGFGEEAFEYGSSLRGKFYETDKVNGTPGTYTRPNVNSNVWTKK